MIKFKAPSNIALLKYWGKSDNELIIPTTSSISMTLDSLFTTTTVEQNEDRDIFILNDVTQNDNETNKISKFIDLFRTEAKSSSFVKVTTTNNFPTAAGLASSASGFAALAGALNIYFDLRMDDDKLSTFARRGSGSASRSLHGGFVMWEKGYDNNSSKAIQIDQGDWDIHMIIVICNREKKVIGSRDLMKTTMNESIFYNNWVTESNGSVEIMKNAIINHDFTTVGKLARRNAWQMHATMLGIDNPFTYLQTRSFEALSIIDKLRSSGIEIYETMDAGPNIKILVQQKNIETVLDALSSSFKIDELIVSGVGNQAKEIVND